jgi:hypothetical protein
MCNVYCAVAPYTGPVPTGKKIRLTEYAHCAG